MNNPFDYWPDEACARAFRELEARLVALAGSGRPEGVAFCRELEAGKMLGVLVASDGSGARHTLYAFSGQAGDAGFRFPGFVGPVFDYLQPDGYFKRKEGEISRLNAEATAFETGEFARVKADFERAEAENEAEIRRFKDRCRRSKSERDEIRMRGDADEAQIAAMTRQSQFEKAELRRLKKRLAERLEPFAANLRRAQSRLEGLKERRRADSEALQKWLFSNFMVLNARGESRSLSDIFADTPLRIPPSGAGECCAPKLLQAAYLLGWRPEAIAEYWYGAPKGGQVRIHGVHYPACRGKCLPVLGWMLRGLVIDPPLCAEVRSTAPAEPRIIFENQWFCVVDKPAGLLSVPGRGRAPSVEQWLKERYGAGREVKMAHRLDQDTSGLIVATFGPRAFKTMQALFATRKVAKTYVALLEGDFEARGIPPRGRISLPLSPDPLDRPRQRVDLPGGKEAVTNYEFRGTTGGRSRIIFHPLTGRTHQLRVHAASEAGLGMPIAGDRLYGRRAPDGPGRLLLHALRIEFTFPPDGEHYRFESPLPF